MPRAASRRAPTPPSVRRSRPPARTGKPAAAIAAVGDGLVQLVAVPVLGPDMIGLLVLGTNIDDATARDLEARTGSSVSVPHRRSPLRLVVGRRDAWPPRAAGTGRRRAVLEQAAERAPPLAAGAGRREPALAAACPGAALVGRGAGAVPFAPPSHGGDRPRRAARGSRRRRRDRSRRDGADRHARDGHARGTAGQPRASRRGRTPGRDRLPRHLLQRDDGRASPSAPASAP